MPAQSATALSSERVPVILLYRSYRCLLYRAYRCLLYRSYRCLPRALVQLLCLVNECLLYRSYRCLPRALVHCLGKDCPFAQVLSEGRLLDSVNVSSLAQDPAQIANALSSEKVPIRAAAV